eukprot:scaffold17448_cov203-Skeletonema_dohrnii-CCMP3373.AAC.3
MNSLTIVGGKVIETEELNSMHDRLSKTGTTSPKNSSISRMNSPRSSQIKKAPMRRSTSSSGNNSPVAKPKMSRHVSAPSSATTETDEGNKKTITIPVRPADLHLPPRSPRFKMKVSTTPTSSSAASTQQQKHNNSQLINILETLSQQEAFTKSSYFRGVFTRGIDKMKQHTHRIGTIEEALELCFDVSDDMRKVISAKVHAEEMMAKVMSSPTVVEDSSANDDINSSNKLSRPWESSPRSNSKKPRPWETDGASSNRRPSVQEYMEQVEARIHETYNGGSSKKEEKSENKLSVFRANSALEVAVESEKKSRSPFDEALVSPRLIRRKGEDLKHAMPLMDEALVSPRLVRRKGMNRNEMMSPFQDFDEVEVETHPAAHVKAPDFAASEHLVKELELLDDRKRMTLELENNRQDMERLKDNLAEAEMAVQTLEESVRALNKATKDKDEIIGRLESKVKEEQVASAGCQKAHQDQVQELGTAVAQLNILVKKMEEESKEVKASLAEAVEKHNKSEAELEELQSTMAKKDEEHAALVQGLENERDDLAKEFESSRETMTSSLENATKQMDGTIKEKDKLIYSLSAKIEILESNIEDMKERKLEADVSTANKEKELNEKIHELATTLIEKDEKMAALEKEIEELKISSKKGNKRTNKRTDKHERRQTKRRPWEDQDIDSLRSSFESKEERTRPHRKSSHHRRRSHGDDRREARPHKGDRGPARGGYSTPEPYYEDERDDGYGYPEREGALFSPVDDDSYIYRRHM